MYDFVGPLTLDTYSRELLDSGTFVFRQYLLDKSVVKSLTIHAQHSRLVEKPFYLAKQATVAAEPLIGWAARVAAVKVHQARDRAIHPWKDFPSLAAAGGVLAMARKGAWADARDSDSDVSDPATAGGDYETVPPPR